ncbi:MAG TPA: hypothetical protein VGK71_05840 [Nitrospirota bacterium]
MKKIIIVMAVLALFCSTGYAAEVSDIPPIIKSGFDTYKEAGADAALKAWLKGSALENSKEALSQSAMFKQVETFYGKFISYDFIGMKDISPSTRIYFICMNYNIGPLFTSFTTYKSNAGWLIVNYDANTKPHVILPQSFFDIK